MKKSIKKAIKLGKKEEKIEKIMHEFKKGKLHSGSKKGPKVKKKKQAIAIAMSEAGKHGGMQKKTTSKRWESA